MHVVALNGSPRRDGNTSIMLRTVMAELEKDGISTEMIQVGGRTIKGCRACYICKKNKDRRCAIIDDPMNEWIAKMDAADGILIGTPTYFANMTSETKALIDRAGLVARANGDMFKRKPGAGVVAVRRAGSIHAFDGINHFFLIGQMLVVGSTYWNLAMGGAKGEVQDDKEGMETMKTLGQNMAWTLKRLQVG